MNTFKIRTLWTKVTNISCHLFLFLVLTLLICQSALSQVQQDSVLSRLRFISAEKKSGKDSIVQFYNNALLFLSTNSECIDKTTLNKFQKIRLTEIYYKVGEIHNNKTNKKGFSEKVNYKNYLALKKEENIFFSKCIREIDTHPQNSNEYTRIKKGVSPIRFSEVLSDGNSFYFHGSLNRKDISVIIYFKFSSISKIEYCSIEEVIY